MLDTKLKNGNEITGHKSRRNNARWTGIILTVLAAALLLVSFPMFGQEAWGEYESYCSELLETENFIYALLQSNYVLYKNLLDKSEGESHTFEEIYMTTKVEDVKGQFGEYDNVIEDYLLENAEAVDISQLKSIRSLYAGQIQDKAEAIQNDCMGAIERRMDYFVLDKNTGIVLKNTTQPIEQLLPEQEDSTGYQSINTDDTIHADEIYDYYVILDYDENGILKYVSVKGQDADALYKTVRSTESGHRGRLLTERDETEAFALYNEDTDEVEKLLSIGQKKPSDVTFVYAMTQEQKTEFLSGAYGYFSSNFGLVPRSYSYYWSGVASYYIVLIIGVFVITMLLALCRPGLLEGSVKRKAPLEIICVAACIIVPVGMELVVMLLQISAEGVIQKWLANLGINVYAQFGLPEVCENVIIFCVLAALFGIWYFCCLEVSDLFRNIKEYFKTRCLLYRVGRKVGSFCYGCYRNLKDEVLHVDLGKDMNKLLRKLVFINFCLLTIICMLWLFGVPGLIIYSIILYCVLKKYIHKIQMQYEKLLNATNSIAKGHLNNAFEEDFGIFESYKEELYKIQDGFKNAVDEEVKSQKMKTELITNVSHDLKTPLTAIITYIDLLKEENITEEQRKEYLDTLERKSLRLKILIEDLFEVSKANSGNVKLEPVPVDICNLIRQVYLEYEEKMKQAGLSVRFEMPEEKIILHLDSQKTYRIFENLYVNIIKYTLTGTRVFVTAEKRMNAEYGQGVHIELKNISAQEITNNAQNLTERFVRGDASRNTEGSGLGLAIVRSFTELQGGTFRIETDCDLFKAVIDW